jgi:hypothetical protein
VVPGRGDVTAGPDRATPALRVASSPTRRPPGVAPSAPPRPGPGGSVVASLGAALLAAGASAMADRPLVTDEASVNERGVCEVEAFGLKEGDSRGAFLGAGCGIGANLELGAEYLATRPRFADRGGLQLQIKAATPASDDGSWAFGAKVTGLVHHNPLVSDTKPDRYMALGLASRSFAHGLAAHLNLGAQRDVGERRTLAVYGAAVTLEVGARGLVFGELFGDNRSGAFRNAGARLWLIPERLGLDVSVARQAGVPGSTLYTVGLGGYGLRILD